MRSNIYLQERAYEAYHQNMQYQVASHSTGVLDLEQEADMTLAVPTLHIRLLGNFLVTTEKMPVTSIDMPRLQSLLAYLVLHRGTPQSRSRLAYLLWPDSTDAQAHTNLRTLVHRLRNALPDADHFLKVERQTLCWQPDAPWTFDVMEFEHAMARAEQAEHAKDSRAERQALEAAVKLYQGDLLPGCYDEWILLERDRLYQMFLKALERLIVLLEQEHQYDAAIRVAQRLLRHEPLYETAYRHLMRLQAASGNRAGAMRTYTTCVKVLERELAVAPSSLTRDLYQRIVQAEEPQRLSGASPLPQAQANLQRVMRRYLPVDGVALASLG